MWEWIKAGVALRIGAALGELAMFATFILVLAAIILVAVAGCLAFGGFLKLTDGIKKVRKS